MGARRRPQQLVLCIFLQVVLLGQPRARGTGLGICDAGDFAHQQGEHELVRDAKAYLLRIQQATESAPEAAFHGNGTSVPVGSFKVADDTHLDKTSQERRTAVKRAVEHAWDAYAEHAWGYDELLPISKKGVNNFAPGLGVTIVDSLSTLYLMGGLDGRYERARDWIATSLDFDKVGSVIVFETVIRVLGGLVSMYHLSGDDLYMRKAEELGVRLAGSFGSPSGYPWPRAFLNETGRFEMHSAVGDSLYLAEVGTVQLEYRALSHHSREPLLRRVRAVTEGIIEQLQRAGSHSVRLPAPYTALLPFSLSLASGRYSTNMVTLGAPADSYFEYLVKAWVQGGAREPRYWQLFAEVVDGISGLASYTSRNGHLIVRDILPDRQGKTDFNHKMDHFACYIPGMIVLGLRGLGPDEDERRARWERLAEGLTDTCNLMYEKSPSGLSGEHIRLGDNDQWRMTGGYHLRPEAVEAFFYMWRHTKKQKYRDYAWNVFNQIERHCKIKEGGYAVIRTARSSNPKKQDIMHSFLIAETFKYIFLIFGPDDELPLDKWVFNTEAHPLLITPGLAGDAAVREAVEKGAKAAKACKRERAELLEQGSCGIDL